MGEDHAARSARPQDEVRGPISESVTASHLIFSGPSAGEIIVSYQILQLFGVGGKGEV